MANKNLSSWNDQQRLQKKVKKLKEIAWREMNEVGGNDPKYSNRLKVWQSLDKLFVELGGEEEKLN